MCVAKLIQLMLNYYASFKHLRLNNSTNTFWKGRPAFYLIFYTCCTIISNIRFVQFCAEGARTRVHFPAIYFLYFVARFCQTPSLFFENIIKEKTSKRKKVQLRDSISLLTSIYWLISRNENMEKSEFSVVKWSSRNKGFKDKKERED